MSNNQGANMFKSGDTVYHLWGNMIQCSQLEAPLPGGMHFSIWRLEGDRPRGVELALCFKSEAALIHAYKLRDAAQAAKIAEASDLRRQADEIERTAHAAGRQALEAAPR